MLLDILSSAWGKLNTCIKVAKTADLSRPHMLKKATIIIFTLNQKGTFPTSFKSGHQLMSKCYCRILVTASASDSLPLLRLEHKLTLKSGFTNVDIVVALALWPLYVQLRQHITTLIPRLCLALPYLLNHSFTAQTFRWCWNPSTALTQLWTSCIHVLTLIYSIHCLQLVFTHSGLAPSHFHMPQAPQWSMWGFLGVKVKSL